VDTGSGVSFIGNQTRKALFGDLEEQEFMIYVNNERLKVCPSLDFFSKINLVGRDYLMRHNLKISAPKHEIVLEE